MTSDSRAVPDHHRHRVLEDLALPGAALLPASSRPTPTPLLGCCQRLGVEGLGPQIAGGPLSSRTPSAGMKEAEVQPLAVPAPPVAVPGSRWAPPTTRMTAPPWAGSAGAASSASSSDGAVASTRKTILDPAHTGWTSIPGARLVPKSGGRQRAAEKVLVDVTGYLGDTAVGQQSRAPNPCPRVAGRPFDVALSKPADVDHHDDTLVRPTANNMLLARRSPRRAAAPRGGPRVLEPLSKAAGRDHSLSGWARWAGARDPA